MQRPRLLPPYRCCSDTHHRGYPAFLRFGQLLDLSHLVDYHAESHHARAEARNAWYPRHARESQQVLMDFNPLAV